MVTIRTKISIVLHFARKSNQRRIEPRRFTDKVDGWTNQSANVRIVFAYGQAKEKINIKTANSCPPAVKNRIDVRRNV